MAFTSAKNLSKLLYGQLGDQSAFNSARLDVANLTNQRIRETLGRFATTGMGRTGIQGAVLAQIQKAAGESYGKVAGEESNRRSQIINQLLGLYQNQIENERSKTSFGDFLGAGLGMLTGSLLGPIGAAGGSYLGNLLTGGKSSKLKKSYSNTEYGDYSTLPG